MKLQVLEPETESNAIELNYSGHTEPCGEFIGHPSYPCERCGFSYYQHNG